MAEPPVHDQPDTGARVLAEASELARLLATMAVLIGTGFTLLWAWRAPGVEAMLSGLIRLRVAVACVALGIGTRGQLAGSGRGRLVARLGALVAGGLGLLTLVPLLLACLRPAVAATAEQCSLRLGAAPMAPMAALLILLGALLLAARTLAAAADRLLPAGCAAAYAGTSVCAVFVCAHLYAVGPATVPGVGPLILPIAAVCLLCLYTSLALAWTPTAILLDLAGPQPGAVRVRRLAMLGGALIVLLGLARVQMQRHGLIDLEQGTAGLVILLLAGFVASLRAQARVLNGMVDAQQSALERLRAVTLEHDRTIAALAGERTLVRGVLEAAVEYSIIGPDAAGRISVFSDGAGRMLGYTPAEMVGRATPEVLHDAEEVRLCAEELGVAATMEVFFALAGRGASDTREWTYVTKGGRRLPVALSVAAITAQDGSVCGLVGVARDLTAFKRSQRERERLFEVGQELLCIATFDGLLRQTNAAFARVVGYRADQLEGRPYLDFVHPDDRAATLAATATLVGGQPLRSFENRWRSADGSYRTICWSVVPDLADGTMVAGGWDVTADKQRAQELAKQIEFEQQLIGIVSHDLRNPVGAITLSAGLLLRREDLPAAARRSVHRIEGAGQRAERMLHDLLDFTRARRGGGVPIARRAVVVDDAIGQVVEELAFLHPDRRISLRPWGGGSACIDPDRVAQAVGNLLSNAATYSPPGAAIVVSVDAVDAHALAVDVHNEGPPIPPALLPHLFKPLTRGAHRASSSRSVGLGLYIVDQIAQAHGGRVEVRSAATEGTTFRVLLPHALAPAAAARAAEA